MNHVLNIVARMKMIKMILSDKTIKKKIFEGDIIISPMPVEKQFQPSSLDLRLDYIFKTYKHPTMACIDTKNKFMNLDNHTNTTKLKYRHDPFIIQPNDFVLAQTLEKIGVPNDIVGVVEGRSSFGRLGLLVHVTAGYIDPGFEGNITLEIKNLNTIPLAIYPEQRICQIVFHELDDCSEYPYGSLDLNSKYQFQNVPTVSKIGEEYD